ncbi:hypothetical protein [Kaarinaea lacus]
MTNESQQLAAKVVETFSARINDNARAALTQTELQDLKLLVQEALANQKNHTVRQFEEFVKTLRAQTDRAEIGL